MSIYNIVRSCFVTAAVLSASSLAFARQPPALVAAQELARQASCVGAPVVSDAGYRHAFVRFGVGNPGSQASAARQSSGYRDAQVRFGLPAPTGMVACSKPTHSKMLSASR